MGAGRAAFPGAGAGGLATEPLGVGVVRAAGAGRVTFARVGAVGLAPPPVGAGVPAFGGAVAFGLVGVAVRGGVGVWPDAMGTRKTITAARNQRMVHFLSPPGAGLCDRGPSSQF